ncbi:MAG: glycosyltransferase family 9 protein [Bacteroidaceae bacterium]|nr:glycosyltransferase family 9 protein [Bacteroidaceae bacterium]
MKQKENRKILVMRFSAMGDVAMTVPVIVLLARQFPQLRITVLTRIRFAPLFEWMPANVEVRGINLDNYKGIAGLTSLYTSLQGRGFDAVADLHNVLRTRYLRTLFRLAGKDVAVIDKGRKQKHALIGHGMTTQPLKSMFERYADVFRELGFQEELNRTMYNYEIRNTKSEIRKVNYEIPNCSLFTVHCSLFNLQPEDFTPIHAFAGKKTSSDCWIGIAPFAAHSMKIYPLDQMRLVCDLLLERGYKLFLFGAGKEEGEELKSWECDNMRSVCGQLGGLHDELLLISQLDLMISMDSANMHLAAMLGTPTLSLWGATHPAAGFTAWMQTEQNILQIPDLPCRPCSIYGNKPCRLGDHRCMTQITPEMVVEQTLSVLRTSPPLWGEPSRWPPLPIEGEGLGEGV